MRRKPRHRSRFEILESKRVLAANPLAKLDILEHGASGWYLNANYFTNHDVATDFEPLASQDFTNDGVADVLGQANGQWWLQINDGGQLFGVPWGDLPTNETEFLGTGHFNDDSWLDVLVRDVQTGDFLLETGSADGFVTRQWGNWSTAVDWNNFTIRDFDHDGLLDVLASESTGNWWLAKNSGNGQFQNHHWGRFQDYNWKTIVDGDFNGDFFPDMAAMGQDNTWWVWHGSADGFGVPEYQGHWKMGDVWRDVSVADLNNDGRDDLIGRRDDGTLWVGSSTGEDIHTWSWGSGWIASAQWTNVELLDVDNDGLVDQVGQAKDGTLWFAQNKGGKFQNHFWTRTTGSPGFVEYVSSFEQRERISLTRLFPGATDVFQPRQDTVTPVTNLRKMDDRIRISLNDDGFFVVEGDEGTLLSGLDFRSPSGSLRPSALGANIESLFAVEPVPLPLDIQQQVGAEPFRFFLSNTENQITIGNIGWNVEITDEPFVMSFGYELDGERDLEVDFGDGATPVPAFVDEELFDPETEITTFRVLSVSSNEIADDNLTAYDLVAKSFLPKGVEVQTTDFHDFDLDPLYSEWIDEPDPPTPTSVPMTGLLRDGRFVLRSTEPVYAAGIDLQSPLGLLQPVPENDAGPFTFFLANTPNQITWGNLGNVITIDGELTLDAGYSGDPTSGDLLAFVGIGPHPVPFAVVADAIRSD